MATIKDYMDKNENVRVLIDLTPDMESIGIFNKELYDGMLHDIPEKFQQLKVVSEGWLMGKQCNKLYVIKEKEYVIEIQETLSKLVPVKAASEADAIQKVKEQYSTGDIILEAEDLKEHQISVYHETRHKEKEQEERTL